MVSCHSFNGLHIYAIHWARFNAELAPCAFAQDDGVHQSRSADNSIYGTGNNAFSATYTFLFSNKRYNGMCLLFTVFLIQGRCFDVE